jgi:hypothetical protein
VKLAGLEPARPVWTRERVLLEIKRLHREGVALSSQQLCTTGRSGIVSAARKYFASWPEAVTRAGVPRFKRGPWTSWSVICERLRELHRDGAPMTTSALQAAGHADLVAAAIDSEGTWNAALTAAEIPVTQAHQRWTAEAVLRGIRALHRAGVPLGANVAIDRGHRKLVKAATHYFGTWTEACGHAVPSYEPLLVRWTVERLISEIRDRYRDGLEMRSTVVQREAGALTQAAHRLGIRWRDACRRAGVPASAIAPRKAPRRVRWSEAKILAELQAAARAGRPLLVRAFSGGFFEAVRSRFGSWEAAIDAARLGRQYRADRETARRNRLGGATTRAMR